MGNRALTGDTECPFGRPGLSRLALWAGEHYLVIPDEHPRCAGHVLVLTRAHIVDHGGAPTAWLHELEAAQERVRRFLLETFARYSFWENGGQRKEVPHAHLHGIPVEFSIDPNRFEGRVREVHAWADVRCEAVGVERYAYAETGRGRYFIPEDQYWPVLDLVRRQTIAQTEAQLTEDALVRYGPEIVARTQALCLGVGEPLISPYSRTPVCAV
jgi:diadenosine tetraphosphate (Ap4A) HIT family hydrolase